MVDNIFLLSVVTFDFLTKLSQAKSLLFRIKYIASISFFLGHVYCVTLWRLKEKISKHFVATTFALRMSFLIKLEGDIRKKLNRGEENEITEEEHQVQQTVFLFLLLCCLSLQEDVQITIFAI